MRASAYYSFFLLLLSSFPPLPPLRPLFFFGVSSLSSSYHGKGSPLCLISFLSLSLKILLWRNGMEVEVEVEGVEPEKLRMSEAFSLPPTKPSQARHRSPLSCHIHRFSLWFLYFFLLCILFFLLFIFVVVVLIIFIRPVVSFFVLLMLMLMLMLILFCFHGLCKKKFFLHPSFFLNTLTKINFFSSITEFRENQTRNDKPSLQKVSAESRTKYEDILLGMESWYGVKLIKRRMGQSDHYIKICSTLVCVASHFTVTPLI